MSVGDFATKVKAKYPEYQSIDNRTLVTKMIAKYPQYKDQVTIQPLPVDNSQVPQKKSLFGQAVGGAASAINKGYEAFSNAPGVKQAGQVVGAVVGEAGKVIGSGVGTIAQAATNVASGKPITQNVLGASEQNAAETGAFGKQIGAAGVPAAMLGGAGRVVNLALAVGMGYTGYKTFKEGFDQKDYVKMYSGLQDMTVAGLGAKEGLASGDKGLFVNPELKAKAIEVLKAHTEAVGGAIDVAKESQPQAIKIKKAESSIKEGVDKGIKPTVIGKKTLAGKEQFYASAGEAVKTISENRNKLTLTDENGEVVAQPKTVGQFAQAIDQTKKQIYKQYNDLAKSSTGKDAQVDVGSTIDKLKAFGQDIKYTPEVRDYAISKIPEIEEIQNQAPDVIEARIAEYNKSLQNFYRNPTKASQIYAQVDASMAAELRRVLDEKITSTEGPGYAELKKKYGALKTIEGEVNKRAIVEARKNTKGLADLTDIFTGGEVLSGVLTGNPAAIAKGALGLGIKEVYKRLNSPDRYINNMFTDSYAAYPFPEARPAAPTTPTPIPSKSLFSPSSYKEPALPDFSEGATPKIAAMSVADYQKQALDAAGEYTGKQYAGGTEGNYEQFKKIFSDPRTSNPKVKEAISNGDIETLRKELVNRKIMTSEEVDNMLYSQDGSGDDLLQEFKARLIKENPAAFTSKKVAKSLFKK